MGCSVGEIWGFGGMGGSFGHWGGGGWVGGSVRIMGWMGDLWAEQGWVWGWDLWVQWGRVWGIIGDSGMGLGLGDLWGGRSLQITRPRDGF